MIMARGWESKSVESQIEDRQATREAKFDKKSAEDIERDRRRKGLEMSRRRIVSELAATKSAIRRASLEAALKHLDEQLGKR